MNQSLDTLEVSVYQLAQNLKPLLVRTVALTKKSTASNSSMNNKSANTEAAVDELSEALLVQVGKLKEDLQGKIDNPPPKKNNTAAH